MPWEDSRDNSRDIGSRDQSHVGIKRMAWLNWVEVHRTGVTEARRGKSILNSGHAGAQKREKKKMIEVLCYGL